MNTHAAIDVACVLAFALSASPASAQLPTWSQLAPTNSPGGRLLHAMAYDTARQRVVLFGGHNGGPLGDTWGWDGANWTQLAPSASPSARKTHAMAYDAARQRVVLFGGQVSSGVLFGDTWEWDGTNWLARISLNYPSPRYRHAMAYDAARQRVVLFGGYSNSGTGYLGDTWEWDGINWMQSTPSVGPSARGEHAMAYDAARQRVVLFGGYYLGSYLGDTWVWEGSNWTQFAPASSPYGRTSHAMAYDAVRQRVVLFGGYVISLGPLGDTWVWEGSNWTQLAPSGSPSARNGHTMAYDEMRQRVVLFGGGNYLSDTWVCPANILASATAYGAGCGSPALGFVPDANGRPVLGQTASATIVNAPTIFAAVAAGGSNQMLGPFALPVPLAGIGMPGCDLLQSADILALGTTPLTPSTLSFSVPIPNVLSLLGAHLYIQAYAFAPGVNPLQIIISNGVHWFIGNV